jgi:hypothetical protein
MSASTLEALRSIVKPLRLVGGAERAVIIPQQPQSRYLHHSIQTKPFYGGSKRMEVINNN